jgi:hypothetical protein
MRDVDVVANPVHERAAAGIVVPSPGFMHPRRSIWDIGRGAEPAVPIECLGRRLRFHFVAAAVPIRETRRKSDFHFVHFADPAVAHELGGDSEGEDGALPTAGLPDAAVATDGIDDLLCFGPVVG